MKKLAKIYGLNEGSLDANASEALDGGDDVTITFTKNEIATLIKMAQRSDSVPGVKELGNKVRDAARQGGAYQSSSMSSTTSVGGLKLQ